MARLRMMRCFLFRYCGNPKNFHGVWAALHQKSDQKSDLQVN